MLIVCPSCDAQYQVPENAIPPEGREVQCSSCQNVWQQAPASAGAAAFLDGDLLADRPEDDTVLPDADEDVPIWDDTDDVETVEAVLDDDAPEPEPEIGAEAEDEAPKFGSVNAPKAEAAPGVEIRADRGTRLRGNAEAPAAKAMPAKPEKTGTAAAKAEMFRVPPPPPDIEEEDLPEAPVFSDPPEIAAQDDAPEAETSTFDDIAAARREFAQTPEPTPEPTPAAAPDFALKPEEDADETADAPDEVADEPRADTQEDDPFASAPDADADEADADQPEDDMQAASGNEDAEPDNAPELAADQDSDAPDFAPIQADPPRFQRSAHPQFDDEEPKPRPWAAEPEADDAPQDDAEVFGEAEIESDDDGFSFEASDAPKDEGEAAEDADADAQEPEAVAVEDDDGGFDWVEAEEPFEPAPEPEPEPEFEAAPDFDDGPAPTYMPPTTGHPEPPQTSSSAKPKGEDARATRKLTDAIAELKAVQKFAPKPKPAEPVALDEARRARHDDEAEDDEAKAKAAAADEEAMLANIRSELLRTNNKAGQESIDELRASLRDEKGGRRGKAAKPAKSRAAKAGKAPREGGSRRAGRLGMGVAVLLCAALAVVYVFPTAIVSALPASEAAVSGIVSTIDSLRTAIGGLF